MKTRIAVAVASLLVASMGSVAFAQSAPQQTTPPMNSSMNSSATQNNNMNNMSNAKMAQKVKHELTSHGITATNVQVMVNNGTATLTGTVATQKDIRKAKMDAMKVHGIKHVDTSGLHVQGQGQGY